MGAGGSKTRVEVTDPYRDHKEARRLSKFASKQLAPLPNPALSNIYDDDDEQASPGTACPNASTGGSTDASAAALPLLLKPTDGATDTAVVPAIESADDEAGAAVVPAIAGDATAFLFTHMPLYGLGNHLIDDQVKHAFENHAIDIHAIDQAASTPMGNTLLHIAVMHPNNESCLSDHNYCAERLVHLGACVDTVNDTGSAPLHYTACLETASYATTVLLLQGGALSDVSEGGTGCTPLHYAAEHSSELVTLLLDSGARMTSNAYGQSPLDVAVDAGRLDIVKLMQDRMQMSGLPPEEEGDDPPSKIIVEAVEAAGGPAAETASAEAASIEGPPVEAGAGRTITPGEDGAAGGTVTPGESDRRVVAARKLISSRPVRQRLFKRPSEMRKSPPPGISGTLLAHGSSPMSSSMSSGSKLHRGGGGVGSLASLPREPPRTMEVVERRTPSYAEHGYVSVNCRILVNLDDGGFGLEDLGGDIEDEDTDDAIVLTTGHVGRSFSLDLAPRSLSSSISTACATQQRTHGRVRQSTFSTRSEWRRQLTEFCAARMPSWYCLPTPRSPTRIARSSWPRLRMMRATMTMKRLRVRRHQRSWH